MILRAALVEKCWNPQLVRRVCSRRCYVPHFEPPIEVKHWLSTSKDTFVGDNIIRYKQNKVNLKSNRATSNSVHLVLLGFYVAPRATRGFALLYILGRLTYRHHRASGLTYRFASSRPETDVQCRPWSAGLAHSRLRFLALRNHNNTLSTKYRECDCELILGNISQLTQIYIIVLLGQRNKIT